MQVLLFQFRKIWARLHKPLQSHQSNKPKMVLWHDPEYRIWTGYLTVVLGNTWYMWVKNEAYARNSVTELVDVRYYKVPTWEQFIWHSLKLNNTYANISAFPWPFWNLIMTVFLNIYYADNICAFKYLNCIFLSLYIYIHIFIYISGCKLHMCIQ